MSGGDALSEAGDSAVGHKRELRAALIAARAAVSPSERRARSVAIADRVEELAAFRAARTVALYHPLGAEVDPTEIAERALLRGVRLAFPRVVPGERALAFAAVPLEALVRGPLGALEPTADAPAIAREELDCILMPGVAFSEAGHRLGRGGGFYDATLVAAPRAARIGLAFELQVLPSLPAEAHDAQLDALVTEARTLTFARHNR